MYLTWFDNNSWLIEMAEQRILLDPWLVGPLVFGNMPWLFKGEHTAPRSIPQPIDLILLSQGLEDHAHPETLQQLDRQIPVVASPNATKVVQSLGFTTVTTLKHGESYTLADRVQIQATPGSPIGPMLVENGYLLTDLVQSGRLYYEPHGYHAPTLQSAAPVDVVLTPLVNLEIPLLGPIVRGWQSAGQVLEWLQPQFMIPTAAGGDVQFDGLLTTVLRSQGSVSEFRELVAQKGLSTQVLEPRPGDRVAIELVAR